MSLTRSMLTGMGLNAEQVSAIIEAHTDTVNALKVQRDGYKEDADKLADAEKKIRELEEAAEKNDWQEKFEKEHSDFEAYKKDQEEKASKQAVKEAYVSLLKEAGVIDKRIDSVMKVTDLTGISLDKDGKIKDADKHTESIKAEWSDFIASASVTGAGTVTPPGTSAGKLLSMEEIYKKDEHGRYILSSAERQKAIADNMAAGADK